MVWLRVSVRLSCHSEERSDEESRTNGHSALKSLQFGFMVSTKAIFFARLQAFTCFSRLIALWMSLVVS